MHQSSVRCLLSLAVALVLLLMPTQGCRRGTATDPTSAGDGGQSHAVQASGNETEPREEGLGRAVRVVAEHPVDIEPRRIADLAWIDDQRLLLLDDQGGTVTILPGGQRERVPWADGTAADGWWVGAAFLVPGVERYSVFDGTRLWMLGRESFYTLTWQDRGLEWEPAPGEGLESHLDAAASAAETGEYRAGEIGVEWCVRAGRAQAIPYRNIDDDVAEHPLPTAVSPCGRFDIVHLRRPEAVGDHPLRPFCVTVRRLGEEGQVEWQRDVPWIGHLDVPSMDFVLGSPDGEFALVQATGDHIIYLKSLAVVGRYRVQGLASPVFDSRAVPAMWYGATWWGHAAVWSGAQVEPEPASEWTVALFVWERTGDRITKPEWGAGGKYPVASPDGRRMAFVRDGADGATHVIVVERE